MEPNTIRKALAHMILHIKSKHLVAIILSVCVTIAAICLNNGWILWFYILSGIISY